MASLLLGNCRRASGLVTLPLHEEDGRECLSHRAGRLSTLLQLGSRLVYEPLLLQSQSAFLFILL